MNQNILNSSPTVIEKVSQSFTKMAVVSLLQLSKAFQLQDAFILDLDNETNRVPAALCARLLV